MPEFKPDLEPEIIHDALWGTGPSSRDAFERLYVRYEPRVRHAVAEIASKLGHMHGVTDLRQQVWLRFLERGRKLLQFYEPARGSFGRFIYHLGGQQGLRAIKAERKKALFGRRADIEKLELYDERMSDFMASMIMSDQLAKIVAWAEPELDELDRLILVEVYLKEQTVRSLAQRLGIKENTVSKRIERLKKKLAKASDEHWTEVGLLPSLAMLMVVVALSSGDLHEGPRTGAVNDRGSNPVRLAG